jgi:hypothetical protein
MTKTLIPRRPWTTFAAGGILAFVIVCLLAAVSLVLTGCEQSPSEWEVAKNAWTLKDVAGLEDCTYTKVYTGATWLTIIRCPNSSTTTRYSCGKNCTQNITTIDGGCAP